MIFAWLIDSPWLVAAFFAGVVATVLARYGERLGREADLEGRTPKADAEDHYQDHCQQCGGPNVVWFTRNEIWNRVNPSPTLLCPCCFVTQAERAGHRPTAWLLVPEEYDDEKDARIAELEGLNRALAERCHEQSELLSKATERKVPE